MSIGGMIMTIMMPIRVTRAMCLVNMPGMVHAHVQVLVPALNAPAIIEVD